MDEMKQNAAPMTDIEYYNVLEVLGLKEHRLFNKPVSRFTAADLSEAMALCERAAQVHRSRR
jgi:hypothetical protein